MYQRYIHQELNASENHARDRGDQREEARGFQRRHSVVPRRSAAFSIFFEFIFFYLFRRTADGAT
jgi:hypothetical protein